MDEHEMGDIKDLLGAKPSRITGFSNARDQLHPSSVFLSNFERLVWKPLRKDFVRVSEIFSGKSVSRNCRVWETLVGGGFSPSVGPTESQDSH